MHCVVELGSKLLLTTVRVVEDRCIVVQLGQANFKMLCVKDKDSAWWL